MSQKNEPNLLIDETTKDITSTMTYTKTKEKIHWYFAPAFLLFWFVLFFAVVIPIFYHLPDGLTIEEESKYEREFIAERAEKILFEFDRIGPKVVGSYANENQTVQLLLNEINKIEEVMLDEIFDIDIDIQQVSGAYMHWTMINMYQGLQNIVVKFSAKNSTSDSYLLINSHFDSKPGSPGAGDDGAMVVIMLEILRVLATTPQTFKHPIVFLFNGAEENPLQASHGFITQHKWAPNCKALINLDSAGSGNKELLFQSGPNHPWLMNIYRQHVKRPFATTLAEELFQANVIPSDTDFRIFKNFGKLPGLDMAHVYNGYVYHTAFDKANIIPRGTLQSTGDNVLALTRAFADSDILENSSDYAKGHTVFYDFLRLFFVYYTETVGKIINACISLACIITTFLNIWLMSKSSHLTYKRVLSIFGLIFLLHLIGIVMAFGLPLLMGVIFDAADSSMTWFTNRWLVIGLYICPALFGLSAPTLIYLSLSRNDKLSQPFRLQMVLDAHSLILSIICFIITFVGYRSSYLLMISLAFYLCAVLLNLITTLYKRKYYWTILIIISQIMTFLYFSYVFYAFFCVLTHMMGRFGSAINPDLLISIICALGTVLGLGFVIPLLNIFRRPILILTSLAVVTLIFVIFAVTPLGFPYRAKTNVGRINFLHVRRVFYEYNGDVSRNESGYYFDFQDRRIHYPIESSVNLTGIVPIADDCDEEMMCGLPFFNHRWSVTRKHGRWLPREEPVELPDTPTLTLINKAIDKSGKTVLFEFELTGPPHMSIFLQPMEGVTTIEWSFLPDMIKNTDKYQPPYHIYFSYGNDNSTLKFFFVFEKRNGGFNVPLFELGISAHYVSFEHERDAATKSFLKSFPKYIHVMEWPSSYERYIF